MDAAGGYHSAAIRVAELRSANRPSLYDRDPHGGAHTTKPSGHRVRRSLTSWEPLDERVGIVGESIDRALPRWHSMMRDSDRPCGPGQLLVIDHQDAEKCDGSSLEVSNRGC
jgi:hypothetical protein